MLQKIIVTVIVTFLPFLPFSPCEGLGEIQDPELRKLGRGQRLWRWVTGYWLRVNNDSTVECPVCGETWRVEEEEVL